MGIVKAVLLQSQFFTDSLVGTKLYFYSRPHVILLQLGSDLTHKIGKMSNSDVEFAAEDEHFGFETFKNRKSQFMELTFEERVLKMRAYFVDKEFPFYNMSKEEKRNFRCLSKQFIMDDDGETLKKKVQLRRKESKGIFHNYISIDLHVYEPSLHHFFKSFKFNFAGIHLSSAWITVITDPVEKIGLIRSAHIEVGGHCGVTKTHRGLTSRCFWEGMSKDVRKYVGDCERCQKSRINKLMKSTEDLHPIPVPTKVWAQVRVDIMSMKEVDGFKYIITAMDYFSKNIEMRAIKAKSAKEVTLFIYEELICRWGSPDVIITDRGENFVTVLMTN